MGSAASSLSFYCYSFITWLWRGIGEGRAYGGSFCLWCVLFLDSKGFMLFVGHLVSVFVKQSKLNETFEQENRDHRLNRVLYPTCGIARFFFITQTFFWLHLHIILILKLFFCCRLSFIYIVPTGTYLLATIYEMYKLLYPR